MTRGPVLVITLCVALTAGCFIDPRGLRFGGPTDGAPRPDADGLDGGPLDGDPSDADDADAIDADAIDADAIDADVTDADVTDADVTDADVTDADVTDADVPVDNPCPPALGVPCDWASRLQVTFDNSAQDERLDGFPVLVVLEAGTFDFASTLPAGRDLRFVDADLSGPLPHEIELWEPAGRSYVWVRVPEIPARSDTDHVWLYWGSPTAVASERPADVWSPGFEAVWHLDASLSESTGLGHSATSHGAVDVEGRIGRGRELLGAEHIETTFATDTPRYTVEIWAHPAAPPRSDANVGMIQRDRNFQLNWGHFTPEFRRAAGIQVGGEWHSASFGTPSHGVWSYFVATYDGDALRAYVNGAQSDAVTGLGDDPDSDTFAAMIGRNPGAAWYFRGRVDEVRISSVARSADWIAAQHLAMTESFVTLGPAELVD